MQTVTEEKAEVTATPTIQDSIAELSEKNDQRLKKLQALLLEKQVEVQVVLDELIRLSRGAIEKNMNPDGEVLAGISDRFALSSKYGVNRGDFDSVLSEISTNEKTLLKLSRLTATGAEMTIISVDASEVLFIDTVDNVNVEAQEEFLSGLDGKERSDAVSTLQKRFPEIERLLQRADSDSGLNYYEYLLICEVTGAEPMPEAEYRTLQDRKPVDRQTICWLMTEQEMLNRGGARYGGRGDREVGVREYYAADRISFRAGRPLLRVQRT